MLFYWYNTLVNRVLGESEVRLELLEVAVLLLGVLVLDGRRDDDILSSLPVNRSNQASSVVELKRVKDSQNLGGVSAGGSRVGDEQTDLLGGVDDEDRSDSESDTLVDVLKAGLVNHVVQEGDLSLGVGDNGEIKGLAGSRRVLNVLDPVLVRLQVVSRQSNQLGVSLGELILESSKGAELSGTDRSEVSGVREQNSPLVSNEVVEVNVASSSLGRKVGGSRADSDSRLVLGLEGVESGSVESSQRLGGSQVGGESKRHVVMKRTTWCRVVSTEG